MSANLTSVVNALKKVYGERLVSTQNLEAKTIDKFEKSGKSYNPGGEGFFGAINDTSNESVGALTETEAFRTDQAPGYAQWKVQPKIMNGPFSFSGLVAKATDSDEEAFANIVVHLMDNTRSALRSDMNRQIFGKGDGLLAAVATAGSATTDTTLVVDTAQYLRKGQKVDIYEGASKVVDSATISSVNPITKVVTFSAQLGAIVAEDAELVKENTRDSAPSDGKELMGLRGIVDDGTDVATFQNIASSNSEWQSIVRAAGGATLTADMLQRLEDDILIHSGQEADMLIMHPNQRRAYLDLVLDKRRFMDGKMDAGHEKITFNGKTYWLDKDCQRDVIYNVKRSEILKFEVAGLELGSEKDSSDFQRVSGYDKYEAFWRAYLNFGTGNRKCHGKISGLAVKAGL